MRRRSIVGSWFAAFACVAVTMAVSLPATSSPSPGDIFKEFTWTRDGPTYIVNHSLCTNQHCPDPSTRTFSVDLDLDNAVRAEAVVAFWSGHVGTSKHAISFNGSNPLVLPLPVDTPDDPECYFSIQGQATIDVPLNDLRNGSNDFQFQCQRQICHNFDYPAFGVYGVNVRVYYGDSRPHPTGTITSPSPGSILGEGANIEATVSGPVNRVAFIGEYEDYDWEGNGVFRQWHYRYRLTEMERHIGTATNAPWAVSWDNGWVPDQAEPMSLTAWLIGDDGTTYVTPVVDGLALYRSQSVRMYRVTEMPHQFGSRVGNPATCEVEIPDSLDDALEARLVVWSSAPHEAPGELGLNDEKLVEVAAGSPGQVNQAFHEVAVSLDLLQQGANTFYVLSDTEHHAMEVHWPGPAILVTFPNTDPPPVVPNDAGTDAPVPPKIEAGAELDAGLQPDVDPQDPPASTPPAGEEEPGGCACGTHSTSSSAPWSLLFRAALR